MKLSTLEKTAVTTLITTILIIAGTLTTVYFYDQGLIILRSDSPTIMVFRFDENWRNPSGMDWHGRIVSEIENEIRRTSFCSPHVRYISKERPLWMTRVAADVVIYGKADDILSTATIVIYSPVLKEEKRLAINYRTPDGDYDRDAIFKMTWESIGVAFDMLERQTGEKAFSESASYVRRLQLADITEVWRPLYSCEPK